MSQNDDELNMQTFQIYQDDPKPTEKEEAVDTKNKGKNKQKAEKTSSGGGSSELVKGLLIGLVIVVGVIVIDMFVL